MTPAQSSLVALEGVEEVPPKAYGFFVEACSMAGLAWPAKLELPIWDGGMRGAFKLMMSLQRPLW